MTDQVLKKCELLVKNRDAIHKKFKFEDTLVSVVAALMFTTEDTEADVDKMYECRKLLKKNTSIFSNLRDTTELMIASRMTLSDDPEKYLEDIKTVYGRIGKLKLINNEYMAAASIQVVDMGRAGDIDEIVTKAEEIMKRMSKDHPVLTSKDDTPGAIFLAISDRSVDTIISDIEEGFNYLKKVNKIKAESDAIQGLCEALALTTGDVIAKCDRTVKISTAFKNNDAPYAADNMLSSLGALAELDTDPDTLAREIIEAADYLNDIVGFKDESMDKKKRMMYASLLVASVYGNTPDMMSSSVISNTVTFVKAANMKAMMSIVSSIISSLLPAIAESIAPEDADESGEADSK